MKSFKIGYFIKEGVTSIFKHSFKSFVSIISVALCLIIMGTFALAAINLRSIMTELEKQSQILAYVDENYTTEQAQSLKSELEALPNVAHADFVSREQAYEEYKSQYEDTNLLDEIDAQVFRDRYMVFLDDIVLMEQTRADVDNLTGIAEVGAHMEIANGFLSIRKIARIVAIAFIVILFVVSLSFISSTIKLTTYDRKEEIAIMKMVGATNSFIRWPFVIGGLILGLVGAGLAYLAQWGLYVFVQRKIIVSAIGLAFVDLIDFEAVAIPMAAVFGAVGFIVGVIGSALAIRNYLKI